MSRPGVLCLLLRSIGLSWYDVSPVRVFDEAVRRDTGVETASGPLHLSTRSIKSFA